MKKRKTLALLINDIDGSYQTYIWLMLKQAAEDMDCNLMVFEGRSLKHDDFAEKQHHIVYSFIEKDRFDGLIITSSSISTYIKYDEFLQFLKKYKDIPLVSIGVAIPGALSVICDTKAGMKELIRHLIDDHNYKRILFVTGPEGNDAAIERLEAYKEVLEEKNMTYDENLVIRGDFVSNTGYFIMEDIVHSNKEYDAIVFSNDDMALGAMKFIEKMKDTEDYFLDKKIFICGFDDSLNASKVNPPLTTVRQPIKEICYKSVESLLNSEYKVQHVWLPSVLVKRASCGCFYKKEDNDLNNINSVKLVLNCRIHENLQTYQIDELFDKLGPALKKSFIESCFIFKYLDGPIFYDEEMAFDENFKVPQRSEMIYAYYNGEQKTIEESDRVINTAQILPKRFIPENKRFTYLVMPLFFRNEHFGYVCFEVNNNDVMIFEMLRGQISNTLKGALMLLERETIEESLRESERLASLGHMIGGISHNLLTPIMSISGVVTALEDLISEYRDSIGDSSVTDKDHYEINSEMAEWVKKLKEYNSYMSNVISTVKSQAVQLNSHSNEDFTIDELENRIKFLKNSDILIKKSNLELFVNVDKNVVVQGDILNMIQILDNLIKNAIQSYAEKESCSQKVELHINEKENKLFIMVKDYGCGIPEEMKPRIFKYMLTTKGKNGTGLSLMLSYSTIKGKFGGEIWFESKENEGTSFFIMLPINTTGKNIYA